jgi:hypothetical protein
MFGFRWGLRVKPSQGFHGPDPLDAEGLSFRMK